MKIVDASVAAKWFLAEPGSAEALGLLESSVRLSAPSIIRVEVFGAISRRYREGKLTESKARAACEMWSEMLRVQHLRLIGTQELLDQAVRLSFELRHALPDCLYLAAAKQSGAELLTADEPFVKRTAKVKTKVTLFAKGELNG